MGAGGRKFKKRVQKQEGWMIVEWEGGWGREERGAKSVGERDQGRVRLGRRGSIRPYAPQN